MDDDELSATLTLTVAAAHDLEQLDEAESPKEPEPAEQNDDEVAPPGRDADTMAEELQADVAAVNNEQLHVDAVSEEVEEALSVLNDVAVTITEEVLPENQPLMQDSGVEGDAAADEAHEAIPSTGSHEQAELPDAPITDTVADAPITDTVAEAETMELDAAPVEAEAPAEALDETWPLSRTSSDVTVEPMSIRAVQTDQAAAPAKHTSSPPTLFVMCLRSIGKHLKTFYNMRLYPSSAPPLSKQFEHALSAFDLSPLYLLEDQRCHERIAAMKRAQQKHKRAKFRAPSKCFQRESVPPYVLVSSIDGRMPASLASLLGLEPQPEHRLRVPDDSDPKATLLHKRRSKWVSNIENQQPQQEETSSDDTAPHKHKKSEHKDLKLHREAVTNIGCGYIAEMIQGHSSLVDLSLQNCQITCAGAIILANAIKLSKTLRRLDLSNNDSKAFRGHAFDNDIRGVGACALASALERNRSLVYFSLSCNHVGVSGATAIAKMLQKNTSLRRIELCKTDVGEAVVHLIHAFERSTTLDVLNLQWCELRPGLGSQLAKIQAAKCSRQPQHND